MRIQVNGCLLELTQGDIAAEATAAIVNAANSRLAGGGGVDGAIHRRAGPTVMAETDRRYPRGCPTGSAVISGAGDLAARHVIHAVGPVWQGGLRGETELLAGAYRSALQLAVDHACESVSLPALSTGAYGYPMDQASRIALATTKEFLETVGRPGHVPFVLFARGRMGLSSRRGRNCKGKRNPPVDRIFQGLRSGDSSYFADAYLRRTSRNWRIRSTTCLPARARI